MFRFSIRELMLVTVIVAPAAGWWVDRRMIVRETERRKQREVFAGWSRMWSLSTSQVSDPNPSKD